MRSTRNPTQKTATADPATVAGVLAAARRRLARAPFEPSTREASLLLGHVLGLGEASLLARPEKGVADAARRRFEELLERRLRGEPVAYLLGEREFFGRPFTVDTRVLIPRPETEHLVEAALGVEVPGAPLVLDLGTGSGCVAVTLALEIPAARVVASDVSFDALQVLRLNVDRHAAGSRVWPAQADLTRAIRLERFDLVVSNPPYIDRGVAGELSPEVVDFEPHAALFAPEGGRSVIERLLGAASALRPGALMMFEIGYDQSEWLRARTAARRDLELRDVVRDYAGIPRTAILRREP